MSNRLIARGAAAAVAAIAGAALAQDVPSQLRPPMDEKLVLVAFATGVQIYECAADPGAAAGYQWKFKAPEAELADAGGQVIGKHYAGPTWESNDGSKVVGQTHAQASSADPGAIPLLLLDAKSHSGAGVLASVRSVQRLDTAGGRAPADACSAYNAAAVARVPYKAKYYFYAAEAY